jgi:peptide/nickel transport system substrate-binding protein
VLQAKHLLEEEGWYDRSGNGVIEKEINGEIVPFVFKLTYYVKNPTTKSICEYISTALKDVGIKCLLNGVDIADLSASMDDKSFDAYYLGWVLGAPPEDIRQIWYSKGAKEKGSSNSIGFSNPEVDKLVEALEFEDNVEKRNQLYHRFDAIIHEEAPYTFLFTPKIAMLYRENVHNVFLPIDRQDLVPGADVAEPDSSIFWLSIGDK